MSCRIFLFTTIALLAFTLCFTPAIAQDPELPTVQDLAVFDTNGKRLGNAVGITDKNRLVLSFKVDDHLFTAVLFTKDHFVGTGFGEATYFDSPDCTGNPFIHKERDNVLPSIQVNIPGNTIYMEDPDATARSVRVRSFLPAASSDGYGACYNTDSQLNNRIRAIPLIDLNTVFTPPFSVRAVGPTPTPEPTAEATTPKPGRPVGGYALMVGKLELLTPWFTLITGIITGAIGIAAFSALSKFRTE